MSLSVHQTTNVTLWAPCVTGTRAALTDQTRGSPTVDL